LAMKYLTSSGFHRSTFLASILSLLPVAFMVASAYPSFFICHKVLKISSLWGWGGVFGAGAGFEPAEAYARGSKSVPFIDYHEMRESFIAWLRNRVTWDNYGKKMIGYMDRFARVIRGPMDVVVMFNGLGDSQKRHLANGMRNLFNFLEAQGWSRVYLDLLRKNLPRVKVGVDLWIPEPEDIVESLRRLKMREGDSTPYITSYLTAGSGLRRV